MTRCFETAVVREIGRDNKGGREGEEGEKTV